METPLTCDQCGKEFQKKNKLNRHVKEAHSDEKPYQCEVCDAHFKRNSHLTRHKKLKHSEDPKSFNCTIDSCVQKFATKQHLDRHIKTIHFGEKIKCEECDIIFNKKSLLAKHLCTVHNQPKPFLCNLQSCTQGFFRETDLAKHQTTSHKENTAFVPSSITGSKRKASFLSENFSTEAVSEMFEKQSEHSNVLSLATLKSPKKEKQLYLCFYQDCLKAFSSKYNLKNHIKTHHLGISEFVCTICESKYKHKKSLQEHMNKCHNPEKIVLPDPIAEQPKIFVE